MLLVKNMIKYIINEINYCISTGNVRRCVQTWIYDEGAQGYLRPVRALFYF